MRTSGRIRKSNPRKKMCICVIIECKPWEAEGWGTGSGKRDRQSVLHVVFVFLIDVMGVTQ